MGANSQIEWTDHTFNPWWGCIRVSPGCEHCYAESQAKRYGHNIWGPASTTDRRFFGDKHWQQPLLWNAKAEAAGERRRVFCASMADVFEDNRSLVNERNRLWQLIRETPSLDWLLLTKRPENIGLMMGWDVMGWPNVWLGTSTENQEQADKRVPLLLERRDQVPVLFLSVEPQLGEVCLHSWLPRLDWVISGFESGPGYRPGNVDWLRHTRNECAAAGVAWFFKQHGGRTHAEGGCLLDGVETKEFPTPRRWAFA
jgi:protein gp37